MLFNSYEFIFIFTPIFLIVFFVLCKYKLIKIALYWLIISSILFYSFWNLFTPNGSPFYILLIIISIIFNYYIAKLINSIDPPNTQSKITLIVGITGNILIIIYYKYASFFLSIFSFNNSNNFDLILPLGISFYTFTQIAYLVDCYRGELKHKNYKLSTYTLFVIFFPQLIAGPILRHDELIPQFSQLKKIRFHAPNFATGINLFCLGLTKKVLIADNLSPWVGDIFSHAENVTFVESWIGALAYTFQLYFDFSGYSDMAIGLGLMINITLPLNFNSPYKAISISDFWRRWHITLSNFLRDYLYISMGGSRRGELRRYFNLLMTMLLGGLWHGAGWTFVLWGFLHGVYLSINHWWRKLNIPLSSFMAWIITFLSVIFSWVLFRASSLSDALNLIKTMTGLNGLILPGEATGKLGFIQNFGIQLQSWSHFNYFPELFGSKILTIFYLVVLIFSVKYLPNTSEIVKNVKIGWFYTLFLAVVTTISLLSLNRISEFLYFQF
ncbi:MAG: MBOAT family O-acyltransferase [Cyanobacterium sp.]